MDVLYPFDVETELPIASGERRIMPTRAKRIIKDRPRKSSCFATNSFVLICKNPPITVFFILP